MRGVAQNTGFIDSRVEIALANASVSGQGDAGSAVKRATQPSTPAPTAAVPHHELRSAPVYNSAERQWDPSTGIICVPPSLRGAHLQPRHVRLRVRESNELFVYFILLHNYVTDASRYARTRRIRNPGRLKRRVMAAEELERNHRRARRPSSYGRLVAVSPTALAPARGWRSQSQNGSTIGDVPSGISLRCRTWYCTSYQLFSTTRRQSLFTTTTEFYTLASIRVHARPQKRLAGDHRCTASSSGRPR